MYGRFIIAAFIVLLLSSFSHARGTRRIVLLEEATSASCGPCAQNNPKLQKFFTSHFGGVVSVRYHTSWPKPVDPMYTVSAGDVDARVQYYGIGGVPTYLMNGRKYGVPSDPEAMLKQMKEQLATPSPIRLRVRSVIAWDTVTAQISIEALEDVNETALRLRVAVIERHISYNTPPGSNGEKDFADVLRKMLPSPSGQTIAALYSGDSLKFEFKTSTRSSWNPEDLAVVAWLQSDADRKIIQAGIDFPTFVMTGGPPGLDLLPVGGTVSHTYRIINDNDETIQTLISARDVAVQDDWDWNFEYKGQLLKEFEVAIPPGDSLIFSLRINTGQRGILSLSVFAENRSDPGLGGQGYGYGFSKNYQGLIAENNDVVLVDDDGGAQYETQFEKALDKTAARYMTISPAYLPDLSENVDLSIYRLIIWNVSWAFPAFTPGEISILEEYLNTGGNLMILGQDIGWDIFDSGGNSNFPEAQNFIKKYFDVKYVSDYSAGLRMEGVAGDPIGDGLSFKLLRPYGFDNFFPEELASSSGKSQPVFRYNNGKIGALRYDDGTFRTVYFGVGLEQIDGQDNRDLIIRRTVEWAAGITDIAQAAPRIAKKWELAQNYPNPFNPVTNIEFSIPNNEFVTLKMYNLLGQEVATLVSEKLKAGSYIYTWNAGSVASGVYLYQLQAGHGFKETKKMMLLR